LIQKRTDLETRTALAWALHANKQPERAWTEIRKVLDLGRRDAVLFYRAGCIAASAGRMADARRLWSDSIGLNPHSPVAGEVSKRLAE
jgi:Flp pilus assembly protein TadD